MGDSSVSGFGKKTVVVDNNKSGKAIEQPVKAKTRQDAPKIETSDKASSKPVGWEKLSGKVAPEGALRIEPSARDAAKAKPILPEKLMEQAGELAAPKKDDGGFLASLQKIGEGLGKLFGGLMSAGKQIFDFVKPILGFLPF